MRAPSELFVLAVALLALGCTSGQSTRAPIDDSPLAVVLPVCSEAAQFTVLPRSYFMAADPSEQDLAKLEERMRAEQYEETSSFFDSSPDSRVHLEIWRGSSTFTSRTCRDGEFAISFGLYEYPSGEDADSVFDRRVASLTEPNRAGNLILVTVKDSSERTFSDFAPSGDEFIRVDFRDTYIGCELAKEEGASCQVQDYLLIRVGKVILEISAVDRDADTSAAAARFGDDYAIGDARWAATEVVAETIASKLVGLY